jgi:hypothetical protein
MKISFLLTVFILILSCGEKYQELTFSNIKTYQLLQLPSGKQIKVIGKKRLISLWSKFCVCSGL